MKKTADVKLAMIRRIFETTRKVKVGNRTVTESSHAGYNLMGAIIDIEHTGKCDKVCLRTLKRVENQIARISAVLEA